MMTQDNKIYTITFVLLILCTAIPSKEIEDRCEVFYHGDVSHLKDSTVVVPEEVVALSPKITVKTPLDTISTLSGTPSIFFLIDHSASMSGIDTTNAQDRWGERFKVAFALVDSIYNLFDSAEVGVSVFRKYLYYDPADDSRFKQCPQQDAGAYLPFFKLDSAYAPDGKMGYDIVKEYIDYDTVTSGNYDYVDLKYTPSNLNINGGNSNITAGFNAAKDAFKTARYPKKQQFIIFFSDGVATYPGQQGSPEAIQYIEDVKADIPTTFTIYFTQDPNPPQDLVDMTNNIKANGYSTMNDSSDLWAIDLGQQTLIDFLVKNVLKIITGTIVSQPIDITINGATVSNYDPINGVFTFNSHFPLTDWTTNFEYEINYTVMIDSFIWVGDSIVDTIQILGDSSTEGSFQIQVVDGASLPTHYPNQFSLYCWQCGLEFYNGTSVINYANETMNDLKIQFDLKEGDSTDYSYSKVNVELSTTEGNSQDKETLTLVNNDTCFIKKFPHEVIPDGYNPSPGDGILQHYAFDSLIATFRNKESPQLPLDTTRHGIPFRLTGYIQSQAAYYFDRTADGYVDSIVVKILTDLDDGLTNEHLKEIIDSGLITLPAFRGFTIDSYRLVTDGFALLVTENTSHEQVTYIRDDDSIKVSAKILSVGGWVEATTIPIYDKVAPIIMRRSKSFQGAGYFTPFLVDFQDTLADTIADTLFIDFSEPVKNISDKVPFYFLNVDSNVAYTANLDLVEITTTSAKFIVYRTNSTKITNLHTGDSVWIHEGNRVADICEDESGNVANNYQNNKNNTHKILTVKLATSTIDTITALPDDSACGECGTGTELAFIPPIGFKLVSMVKKRRKRWAAFIKWLKAKILNC